MYHSNLYYLILGGRLKTDFNRVRPYDLFVVRVKNSTPTVWQRQGDRLRMLCRLFPPFDDSFACLQEWELNTQNHQQVVRLDFLHKIAMPPSTRYESAAFFTKYKAATLGGFNYAIKKEVQRYHVVNQLYSEAEMHQILHDVGFYQTIPDDPIQVSFEQIWNSSSMQPTVEIEELVTESIPTALLSSAALETIQDFRHNRFLERQEGK